MWIDHILFIYSSADEFGCKCWTRMHSSCNKILELLCCGLNKWEMVEHKSVTWESELVKRKKQFFRKLMFNAYLKIFHSVPQLGSLKKLYVYVLLSFKNLSSIWLHRVSVAAQGERRVVSPYRQRQWVCWTSLPCSMWDLSFLTGSNPTSLAWKSGC